MAAAAPAAAQAFPDEHWQLLRPYGEPGENTEFFNVAGAFLLGQEHWWGLSWRHRGTEGGAVPSRTRRSRCSCRLPRPSSRL